MNQKLFDLYQEYVDKTPEERIETAKEMTVKIFAFLNSKGVERERALEFYADVVRLFVTADRVCSKEEWELFNAVLGIDISYEEFYEMVNGMEPEKAQELNMIIDSMDEEAKEATCIFGLTILSADESLTEQEILIFEQILA